MKIRFFSDMTVSSTIRQELPAQSLYNRGHEVSITNVYRVAKQAVDDCDAYCFIRPTAGVDDLIRDIRKDHPRSKIIVDQDDCFDLIPTHHVAYEKLGKGNPRQKIATERSMELADVVTVTTKQLAGYYEKYNPVILPNTWSKKHKWDIVIPHTGIVIGWAGTITHREDFKIAQKALIQILNEFIEVKVVIGNDIKIYEALQTNMGYWCNRIKLMPMLPYYDYPALIRCFDILIAPLTTEKFNEFKSDIKLIEAGAAGIPFVASDMPNYLDWGGGGLYAHNNTDFYTHLKTLIKDRDLRVSYGSEGYKLAQERELEKFTDKLEMLLL